MNHSEEVENFKIIKSLGGFSLLMIGLLQPVLFYIFTPNQYNLSFLGVATVIIIDLILVGSILAIVYKKYHEYHITDTDFYQVPQLKIQY